MDKKILGTLLIVVIAAGGAYVAISRQGGLPSQESENDRNVVTENSEDISETMPENQSVSENEPAADINNEVPIEKNDPAPQETPQIEKAREDWSEYQNKTYGFKIGIPEGMSVIDEHDGTDGYSISFGKNRMLYVNGYDGEWFMHVYDKTFDIEKIIRYNGNQFGETRHEIRDNIKIDDVAALKITITTSREPNWCSENIIIRNGDYIYWISNGAIKSDEFNHFYDSFEFLK